MKDLPDSNKHSLRIAQEKRVIKKRLKLVKKVSTKTHFEHVAEKSGRLAKQHPMDCGNAKCLLCHSEKILKKKKARDKKLDDIMGSHLDPMEGYDDYSID